MPTYRGGERPLYGLKTVAVVPGQRRRAASTRTRARSRCTTATTGQVLAVMNATPITAIRTAAVSGVATRALAREDARVLAIVGAGHQAHPHIAAMLEARQFEQIRIAARTPRAPSDSPPSGRSPSPSSPSRRRSATPTSSAR